MPLDIQYVAVDVDNYSYIDGETTRVIKTGGGHLRRVIINRAGNNSEIQLYDNVSATPPQIAFIDFGGGVSKDSRTLAYNLTFNNGLTVKTVGASTNITIVFR